MLRSRLSPRRLRFTDSERRLLAEKGKPLGRELLAEMASLATPETILRWYRERVAAKYDGSRSHNARGRPAARGDKVEQLLTMARENPTWGYTRLRGALKNLSFPFPPATTIDGRICRRERLGGLSSSPGQLPSRGPLGSGQGDFHHPALPSKAAQGVAQSWTRIVGRGSGKSRSRSTKRFQFICARWLRRPNHLRQALSA